MSTEVTIAKREHVQFPERCVVCNQPGLVQLFKIRHYRTSVFGFFESLCGLGARLQVPLHRECARQLHTTLVMRWISYPAMSLLAIVLGVIYYTFKVPLWILVVLGALIVLLGLGWHIARPVSFEFDEFAGYYILHFRDSEYAAETARLNDGFLEGTEPTEQEQ